MTSADVVVVGGGGAGAPLAARLSEDEARTVLLVEAGTVPRTRAGFPRALLDSGTVRGADPTQPEHWAYPSTLTAGRPYTVLRGRILGGSTTVNGAYFIRARRADFDRWAGAGGAMWAYDRALPLLRRLERDLDYGETEVHGGSGPVPVARARVAHPAAAAFRAAALELGYPVEDDKNAQGPPGVGPVPANAVDGVRWNTGLAYVLPALARPNLRVRGRTTAVRVVVEHGRAVGVELERDGVREIVHADEVVLAAGAIESAHLLLLSGIGPRGDLERAGVHVVRDAPVGRGFSDHPQVVVEWIPREPAAAPAGTWLAQALHVASAGGSPEGDLELLQSARPMAALVTGRRAAPGDPLPMLVSVHATRPSGSVRLASADPRVPPSIDYGYLGTADDRRRMREAVRVTSALLATRAFARASVASTAPDSATLRDDRALDAWVRDRLGTSLHTCGTAPFGGEDDPASVVDGEGRVRGIAGLRVADTSILPSAPTRGPAATAVLIGEVIAQAMRADSS